MYEVRVQAGFSAVHQVRMYDGELEPIHGHDFKAEAVFRSRDLDRIEVLIDFVAARDALREVAKRLDHRNLNNVSLLRGTNPTAEVVARCIYELLREALGSQAPLAAVYVEEAPGCVAGYLAEGTAEDKKNSR